MEDKETLCVYCDKPCDVIIWNGLYDEEDESIYLCERCHRHLNREDTQSLKALRIASQRACANLASGGQSFFDRMDLSALSIVLDEDNGAEVDKVQKYIFVECDICERKIRQVECDCNYEDCEQDGVCRECMEEVDGEFYHYYCAPIEWDLRDAFNKWGFEDGGSNRNYTGDVAVEIEELGYEVECDSWGMHNYVIVEIKRIEGEENIYGGDNDLHLVGYDDDRTFANTLPQDICQALWDYQQECDIDGFLELDREFIFG